MSIAAAILAIGELCREIVYAVQRYRQAKKEGWQTENREITKGLIDAKTDEERRDLARRIASQLRDST